VGVLLSTRITDHSRGEEREGEEEEAIIEQL